MTEDAGDTVAEALRDLARRRYRALRHAYESLTSDAALDEAIALNGWTFTADAEHFG